MFEELPSEVRRELSTAIRKVGEVIAETNGELNRMGFNEYAIVAGSLFYNDPDEFADVPSINVVVIPSEYDDTPGFVDATEENIVAIYSPVTQEAQFKALASTSLSLGKCNKKRKGKKCKSIEGSKLALICKEVPFSGKVSAYLCLPSKTSD